MNLFLFCVFLQRVFTTYETTYADIRDHTHTRMFANYPIKIKSISNMGYYITDFLNVHYILRKPISKGVSLSRPFGALRVKKNLYFCSEWSKIWFFMQNQAKNKIFELFGYSSLTFWRSNSIIDIYMTF